MSDRQGSKTRHAQNRPPVSTTNRPSHGKKLPSDSSQLRRSASGSGLPMRTRSKKRQASLDLAVDSRSDLHLQPREPATRSKRERFMREIKDRVYLKPPRSPGQETHHSEPEMTIDDHHGGKRVMESSEIVPFKQPEPTVVQRPCDPRITSTSPNQYDMQEAQYESTRVNTLVPNGNNGTVNPYHFGQNAVQLQQAIQEQAELINNLETALRQTKADLRAAKQEVQDQERDLGDLRRKVTENATRTIELPLQLPLHCPEGEIMKAWHNLTYDVENLVSNHFRDSKGGRVVTWAKDKKDHLHNLTPHYTDVVKEKKTSAAFIEAAIWNALCVCVFGPYRNNAPFCWAGKYRGSLRTMSNFLLADIDALKSDGYRNRHKAMFHQWKTLTANLVATIVPQGRHNDEKAEIAHDLGDMLDGLPSPRPTQERIADLQGIVDKAVDLAMRLCGQKTWYCVAWYPEKCREVPLDEERMELMVGSPRSKRVRFMVRPGINGSRGEDYENMWVLERCRVWAF